MTNVVGIRGMDAAPKAQRSSMETVIVTLDQVAQWRLPACQRPLRINAKVEALAEEIRRDGVTIPGVITLGMIGRHGDRYMVDGQHRIEAFKMSGLEEAICDLRIVYFDSMSELGREFAKLNSRLVNMRPDDILRAIETSVPIMRKIRSECPYVGYDYIRRGTTSPIVGMAQLVRCWIGSSSETPSLTKNNQTAAAMLENMDVATGDTMIKFLHLAFDAWGRDPEYYGLWGALNLTMCMWMYRQLVLNKDRGVKRAIVLTDALFKQCMMALSADRHYIDFLKGRRLDDRDRSPTYTQLRSVFTKRLKDEGVEKPLFLQPSWYAGAKLIRR